MNELTVEAWIKKETASSYGSIANKWWFAGGSRSWALEINPSSDLLLWIRNDPYNIIVGHQIDY